MNRLSSKEKQMIVALMKKGKSLNYISNLTKRSKSTLYHYYKKICGKKYKDVQINIKDDAFIGELIGLFVGDGYCYYYPRGYRYSVRFFFNVTEENYVKDLIKIFHKNLNKWPLLYKKNNVNMLTVYYYSKSLYNFLLENVGWHVSRDKKGANKKSRTVFLKDKEHSNEFKKGFLRGYIDSDGYLSDRKILFGSASEKIMQQTKQFLSDLGFKNFKLSFYKDKRENSNGIWHLYVHKKEREKFFSLIKPRNLTRVKNPE